MIILDTCALIYDALAPEKLGKNAKKHIITAGKAGNLACSDISLWEIGMLIEKKRIEIAASTVEFLDLLLQARNIQVLSITPDIAALLSDSSKFNHFDPADRIIAATTIHYRGKLVTCDRKLEQLDGLTIIWD
ncbi:MAG: type II toxin-antitoxin system VapC family toxin [Gammaproteobacteria bacterium]